HPSQAARKMLDLKGLDYRLVDVLPLTQRVHLRLAGFRGGTVPALKLDASAPSITSRFGAGPRAAPACHFPSSPSARAGRSSATTPGRPKPTVAARPRMRCGPTWPGCPTSSRTQRLLDDGTLALDPPNAATLQILSSVRFLDALADLHPRIGETPAARAARKLFPDYPEPVPPFLPPEW